MKVNKFSGYSGVSEFAEIQIDGQSVQLIVTAASLDDLAKLPPVLLPKADDFAPAKCGKTIVIAAIELNQPNGKTSQNN